MVTDKIPLRIGALDAYRGYAIFGMILVNYLGHFDAITWLFKHHREFFSYADTIAPIFIFVVGMGFRLSLKRRLVKEGPVRGRLLALRRYLILAFLGLLWGGFDWKVSIWDALLDIALAGILALPFIDRSLLVRVAMAWVYLIFYQYCYTFQGYGDWVMANSIDGGPLGIFSWAFILLMGTAAMDWLEAGDRRKLVLNCLAWGVVLVALGWLFKWPWGDFKAHWPFSQKGMSMPYAFYATGIAFLTYLPFHFIVDVWGKSLHHLKVLGSNALVLYWVQGLLLVPAHQVFPEQWPISYALASWAGFYAVCFAVAWGLHRKGIFVKV